MLNEMKAACIAEIGSIKIIKTEIPQIGPGEALIRIKYAGICGTDIHLLAGEHATATYPLVPGHECVAELIEMNDESRKDLKAGDIVVPQPYSSCGVCDPCLTGMDNVCANLQIAGVHQDGVFAEYAKVSSRKLFKVPNDIDLKLAVLTEPLAVAVHDVKRSSLQVRDKALIIGGGPIGVLIAMVAELAGAGEVIISEVSQYRIDFAEKLGYKTLNPASENFNAQMDKITKGKGFDVVYEVSGSKTGIATMTDFVKIGGEVVLVGISPVPYPVNTTAIFSKQLTLTGVRLHSQVNFGAALEILESGKMNDQLNQLVSKVYDFNDVAEAFHYCNTNKDYFKILLKITD